MQRSVSVYVTWICLGAAASALTLVLVEPDYVRGAEMSVAFLVGLGLLSDRLMYSLPHSARGSISFIPYLAAACIVPHWITVIAVGIAMLIHQISLRYAGIKATFNVAQQVLSLSVAILAYRLFGGEPFGAFHGQDLLSTVRGAIVPVGVMLISFLLINSASVSGVVARSQGLNQWDVWKKNSLSLFTWDLACGVIVLVFAWAYVHWGAIGAGLLALPMMGVRQLYKTNLQLQQVNQDLLELMVKAIEARDLYTSGHSRRVAQYAVTIARAIGLTPREVDRVRTAALLHDVGKIHEVFAPILCKPDRLTAAEWAIMKTHPVKSAELVATATHLRDLIPAIRHHHENWDGSGYPDGLRGDAIPLESRIIMFADTIDAMTTERPYRTALGEAEVRDEFVRCRGTQFDPEICDRLLQSASFSHLFPPEMRSRVVTPMASRFGRPQTPRVAPRVAANG